MPSFAGVTPKESALLGEPEVAGGGELAPPPTQ